MKITEFSVQHLHGHTNATIPIADNRLILVGVNGIGKSTVLNLLYFFLSRQWFRLLEYQFSAIRLKLGSQRLVLTREEIEAAQYAKSVRTPPGGIPSSVYLRIQQSAGTKEFADFIRTRKLDASQIARFSSYFRIPPSVVPIIHRDMIASREEEKGIAQNRVWQCDELLKSKVDIQILYLPTYRRIEKELQVIFPDLHDQLKRYLEKPDRGSGRVTETYTELVEFGMEDVKTQIERTVSRLKESARSNLNSLAGSYLRDVIRGEADSFDARIIRGLDDSAIDRILSRVEEETLSEGDKRHLREVVRSIIDGKATLQDRERYVAHYFGKLVEIIQDLWQKEAEITKFVTVCNSYLVKKRIVYEENSYTVKIIQGLDRQIELQHLSSGEKQIVSLFSHLYLSGNQSYMVVIDEPELSLSVDWQEKFLPHVVNSGHCAFLAAVTHSPFIFDNELEKYAVDLRDCMEDAR
jgi:AAA ATPase domain